MTAPINLDDALDAMKNSRRRMILYAVLQTDGPVKMDVTLEDHHVHIPKLEDAGYVTYVEEHIEPGPNWDEIKPVLESV